MAVPNRSATPESITAQERALQALHLRKTGKSFREIASLLGYADESGARKAVVNLLKKTRYEDVEEARKLELERLDAMEQAISPLVLAGHLGAIDRRLKIMERRDKLLGLSTEKFDVTSDGKPIQLTWGTTPGNDDSADPT